MNILVTGGHGFVGSHIVAELIEGGHTVVVCDVIREAPDTLDNYQGRYVFSAADITKLDDVLSLVDAHGIERILHLAAIKNNRKCVQNPYLAFHTNLTATVNMFEAARLRSLSRVVALSSAAVFGKWPDSGRSIREDDPTSPANLYGVLKHSVEQFAHLYRKNYDTPIVTARISRGYGPGAMAPLIDRDSNPIPQLLWDVYKDGAIHQASGADFRADFSYVKDTAHGLVLCLLTDPLPSELVHIGGGRLYTVLEVAEVIREMFPGLPVEIGPTDMPYAGQAPVRGALDITRAKEELGYSPRYSLREGMEEYMRWLTERGKPYL